MLGPVHLRAYRERAARPRRRLGRMERTANHGSGAIRAGQQSPAAMFPIRSPQVTRSPATGNPVPSQSRITVCSPTASSKAPCTAGRNATAVGPPITSGGRVRTIQDGAIHPARLAPLRRNPASQHHVGYAQLPQRRHRVRATSSGKPSSRTDDARPKTGAFQPALRREMAADRPPMPAPTMSAVRIMTAAGTKPGRRRSTRSGRPTCSASPSRPLPHPRSSRRRRAQSHRLA